MLFTPHNACKTMWYEYSLPDLLLFTSCAWWVTSYKKCNWPSLIKCFLLCVTLFSGSWISYYQLTLQLFVIYICAYHETLRLVPVTWYLGRLVYFGSLKVSAYCKDILALSQLSSRDRRYLVLGDLKLVIFPSLKKMDLKSHWDRGGVSTMGFAMLFSGASFFNCCTLATNYFTHSPSHACSFTFKVRFYSLPTTMIIIYFDALQALSPLLGNVRYM